MSDNEIYLLIKYTKSVLWRVAKRLSYTEDARRLKVNCKILYNKTVRSVGVVLYKQFIWSGNTVEHLYYEFYTLAD